MFDYAHGRERLLLQNRRPADAVGRYTSVGWWQSSTFRGSAACAANPNDPCCHTCAAEPPAGCDGSGCEHPVYLEPSLIAGQFFEDQVTLRCYKQKQRFGMDFLYPVERYANALSLEQICPSSPNLSPEFCSGQVVENPVFTSVVDGNVVTRPQGRVFLAGIVGVPWQDLALDPTGATSLTYKQATNTSGTPTIDWNLLLGPRVAAAEPPGVLKRLLYPTLDSGIDPLMVESVEGRVGTNPVTGQALAGAEAPFMANAINGHEWSPLEGNDLQYENTHL